MSRPTTGLALYDRAADETAAAIIGRYSTSFALACRLLGARPRPHVRNVYALVRIADEVVDGPAVEAGLDRHGVRDVLNALEEETLAAMSRGFSANPVVHAFARTARACAIEPALVIPFFASMRTDIDVAAHDDRSHDAYVYGSAEVVGLMCLQVFVNAGRPSPVSAAPELTVGARRLGAAFQDVNFLRDLDDDARRLGRDYLPGAADPGARRAVLDRVDADLAAAAAVIPLLPADCRGAVSAAHDLFAALSRRLRDDDARHARVRVPDPVKALLAVRAAAVRRPQSARS